MKSGRRWSNCVTSSSNSSSTDRAALNGWPR